jgi:hypothetical protein
MALEQQCFADECLGGRAAKQAWEAAWREQHAAESAGQAGSSSSSRLEATSSLRSAINAEMGMASSVVDDQVSSACVGQKRESAHDLQEEQQTFVGRYQQEQRQQQQHQGCNATAAETRGGQSQQRSAKLDRHQHSSSWLKGKQQRLMRWLRSPTADWAAAEWGFDDSSEGVLVLQLVMADGRVAAVSVRDDKQPAKPTKVSRKAQGAAAYIDSCCVWQRLVQGSYQHAALQQVWPLSSNRHESCKGINLGCSSCSEIAQGPTQEPLANRLW